MWGKCVSTFTYLYQSLMSSRSYTVRITNTFTFITQPTRFNCFIPLRKSIERILIWTFVWVRNKNKITILLDLNRLPFNWKTPLGYTVASAIQILFFFSVLEIFITFIMIYFGICRCAVAFVEDIEQNFRNIHQNILDYNGVFPSNDQNPLYKKLCEIIEFHSNALQLSSFSYKCKMHHFDSIYS